MLLSAWLLAPATRCALQVCREAAMLLSARLLAPAATCALRLCVAPLTALCACGAVQSNIPSFAATPSPKGSPDARAGLHACGDSSICGSHAQCAAGARLHACGDSSICGSHAPCAAAGLRAYAAGGGDSSGTDAQTSLGRSGRGALQA